jgi:hypothetical protein
MATNSYFRPQKGEQRIIEDLVVESIKIHGHDFVYMPRTLVKEDELFGEDVLSAFNKGVELEMYIESVDGFEGDGDFISKFGLEIRDSVKISVSKKRFEQEITTLEGYTISNPREGDLIYFPLTKGLFEIKFVEHENPFYQLGKLYVYSLSCELFQYSQEDINTGWTDIDKIETTNTDLAININMNTGSGTYLVGEKVWQGGTSYSTSTFNANVVDWTSSSNTLQIAGSSGSLNASLGLTGNDSSAFYTIGSTGSPAVPTDISPDAFSDNRDLQIEADDIFDFTDSDPFSEGKY